MSRAAATGTAHDAPPDRFAVVQGRISTSASISTGMFQGSSAKPTAERACCPSSGP